MNALFGVSETVLATALAAFVVGIALLLAILALRNRVIFKMGIRNTTRRRGQTVLIVFGLMLSTILVTTSFVMGDTVSSSLKASQLPQVGNLDEGISKQISVVKKDIPYFSADEARQIVARFRAHPYIDQVVGAIMTPQQSIPVFDVTTQQISAENAVLAVPPDFEKVWGKPQTSDGYPVSFRDLHNGQVYIGATLAAKLNAHVGDAVHLFINQQPVLFTVGAILSTDINPVGGTSKMLVVPLAQYEQLIHQPGSVNTIYVKNRGQGGLDDLGPDNRIANAVTQYLHRQFPADQIATYKLDAINNAASQGSTITLAVSSVGLLLILAGMLLIYLIFVMLANERKAELGMSRAVGILRRHLIYLFVFEGMVYTIGSTLVGIFPGIAIAAILVQLINHTPLPPVAGQFPLFLQVSWQSVLMSFCLGMLFTFLVVTFSAYRVSRVNIIAAIRDLENPPATDRSLKYLALAIITPFGTGYRASWRGQRLRFLSRVFLTSFIALVRLLWALSARGPLLLLIGLICLIGGIQAKMLFPYDLGVSLLLLAIGLMVRWLLPVRSRIKKPAADRLGLSLLNIGLLLYWTQPFGPWEKLFGIYNWLNLGSFQAGIEIFFLSILVTLLSTIWLVIYNGDLLIKGVMTIAKRWGRVAAVVRPGMAYPLTYKFRTGMIVTMFSLVTFITILIVALTSTFNQNAQVDRYTGGWELQTDSANLPPDFIQQIKANSKLSQEIDTNDISWLDDRFYETQQIVPGKKMPTANMLLRAVNDTFLNDTTIALQARAAGYTTDRQVWDALKNQPGLAILWNYPGMQLIGTEPDFQPFEVQVQDPQHSGAWHRVRVIGILPGLSQWPGLYVSTRTGAQIYPSPITPRWYNFRLRPGYTDNQVRLDMGVVFGARYGIEVETLSEKLGWSVGTVDNIALFLSGYLALGLIIGICGLGVISSRAVIERRQQIGMLRAIGYSRRLVQSSFLLETSFIALLGLFIGATLGIWSASQTATLLIPSRNVLQDTLNLPFLELALILVCTYLATLLTTYVPARIAASVRPAEALRYE